MNAPAFPNDTDEDKNITPIFDVLMNQYHSATLVIFGRLGLFDYIHHCTNTPENDGVTVDQIATYAKWSVRATSAMLISLVTSGILEATVRENTLSNRNTHSFEHTYRLTQRAAKFLLSDAPGNMVPYLELFWECSPQLLLEKAAANKQQDNFMLETGDGAPSDMFINAMQGQTSHAAMVLAPLLAEELSVAATNGSELGSASENLEHFVDVGGGSGALCHELCNVMPHWKGSIYELDGVCPIAEKFIQEAELSDRVKAVPGNMFNDKTFPRASCYGFGNVLHDWSDDVNRMLLQKAFDSLPETGGKVLIVEMLVSEDVGSTSKVAAGLNLVMVTNEDGRQYKASEIKVILESIGFVDIKVITSSITPYSAVLASKEMK